MQSQDQILIGLLIVWIICGFAASGVGKEKNRDAFGSFCWGLFLGVFGVIIVALLPTGSPPPPQGMSAQKCLRCNAVQNIPQTDESYECWQCHLINSASAAREGTANGSGHVPPPPPSPGPKRSVRCPTCQNTKKIPIDAASAWCPYCRSEFAAAEVSGG